MHFDNDVENDDDDEIISPKSGFALNTKKLQVVKRYLSLSATMYLN